MVLQKISGGYDDVQNTAPSSPNIGDTWLDTSTDPPTGKIYADLGGGGQWTTDLLDQPVSEAGSTQSELADGADESDGRWQTIVNTAMMGAFPDQVTIGGSGATPEVDTHGVRFTSATSGDNGRIRMGGLKTEYSGSGLSTGGILIKVGYTSPGTSIDNLGDHHFPAAVGKLNAPLAPTDDNIAVFNPSVGNSTTGNVKVDNGGIDTDGSVSYETLTDIQHLTLWMDFDGHFLSPGHTGFYVNGDPRAGDSPDADLGAVPNIDDNARKAVGMSYTSNGNGQGMDIDHLEISRVVA